MSDRSPTEATAMLEMSLIYRSTVGESMFRIAARRRAR
jgi:hypothetical protein